MLIEISISISSARCSDISMNYCYINSHEYYVKKKETITESTKYKPCDMLFPRECEDKYLNTRLKKDYNCSVPLFYTGQHSNFDYSVRYAVC